MKKLIFSLIALIATLLPAVLRAEYALPGQWRVFNSMDNYFQDAIDTPRRLYIFALGQRRHDNYGDAWKKTNGQLFVYDKEHDELIGYNASNYLHGDVPVNMAYNAAKGYLLIVYDDYTIDLLYDDDTLYTIPALAGAALSSSKNINSITFDPEMNCARLATDFGYLTLDDERYVISESRIYNIKLNAIARVGDSLLIGTDAALYTSPVDDRHTSIDAFTRVEACRGTIRGILPLTASTFAVLRQDDLSLGTFTAGTAIPVISQLAKQDLTAWSENRDGYLLKRREAAVQLARDGAITTRYLDKVGSQSTSFGSWDLTDFFLAQSRDGIRRYTFTGNQQWQDRGTIVPNAPRPFAAFSFAWSPDHGMLAANSGFNRIYSNESMNYPALVSGYKDGEWSHYGMTALPASPFSDYMREATGMTIDPVQPQYMWISTRRGGLFRVNLEDNSAEMFAYPGHKAQGTRGFHAVFPLSTSWNIMCIVSAPSFDADGNLWCVWNPANCPGNENPVYCWPAADRKAGNVSAFRNVPVSSYAKQWLAHTCLATQATRNLVLYAPTAHYYATLFVLDHGGTLTDTSDDRIWSFNSFVDQDGSSVPYIFINCLYEDPATGYIWVGTDAGLFYIDPAEVRRTATSSQTLSVRRVKVARNDGTNQADYLLNGYDVHAIAADGAGRKWFATMGGGVTVTTADGGTILERFSHDNSSLPTDNVYALGFDPTGNAVWMGTSAQICTYFCDATPAADDYKNVLASPNPVRPEYHGQVTITGLMDGSLVKIADASGAVIRELGLSNGGMALWDLTDASGREVSAGVYYILTSTTSESAPSAGNTSKILVIR